MKILQTMLHGSAHETTSGAMKVLFEFGNHLSKRGHDVTSLYNDTSPGKPFYEAKHGNTAINLSVQNHGSFHKFYKLLREITRPLRNTELRPYFPNPVHFEETKRLAKPVGEFIKKHQPDVILAHGADDVQSIMLGVDTTIPIIHLTHSEANAYFRGLSFFDRRRLQKCAAIQALTPSFAEEFTELLNTPVSSIPNIVPIPTEFANPDKPKSRKRIIMHSRLDKKKQPHVLLESFSLVKDEFPEWDVYIFGGEQTKGYKEHLDNIIKSKNMKNRAFIYPATSEVEKELCKSDIFAFPSIDEEGWGLALTEAMSVGLPCISIKSTKAVNYLITSENAGLLCDNDVIEFAAQLKILMANPKLRKEYGDNAKLGMSKYCPDSVCEQWEALIKSVTK